MWEEIQHTGKQHAKRRHAQTLNSHFIHQQKIYTNVKKGNNPLSSMVQT